MMKYKKYSKEFFVIEKLKVYVQLTELDLNH